MTNDNETKHYEKYETIIVIILVLLIFTILFNCVVSGPSSKSLDVMRKDALTFGKAVGTDPGSFHNADRVSLSEAINESVIPKIKNPTGGGYCDETESKSVIKDGKYFVTLHCGDYLIDNNSLIGIENSKIYKVGKWEENKIAGAEKRILYNCKDKGKLVYPEYYDEEYFVYKINQDNNTDFYFATDVNICKVTKKVFYRKKELYSSK